VLAEIIITERAREREKERERERERERKKRISGLFISLAD